MTQTVLGVGIDTARYGHHAFFLDQNKRQAAAPFHFKEDAAGYERLKKVLATLAKKHPMAEFRVHLDPAGSYANNLTQFLQSLESPKVIVSIGRPEANESYRKAIFGKKKADPVESAACARFAISEKPAPAPVFSSQMESLRRCVSTIEAVAKQKTQTVNQLHAILANTFPELAVYVSDISSCYCLKLLEKYPTAKRIAAAKLDSLLSIPHMGEELAKAIHAAAKRSTACSQDEIVELLVQQRVKQIQLMEQQHKQLEKTLVKAWDSLPEGPYKQLITICGFGIQTAASLVAKIVDIQRFESSSDLIGYFGCYPEYRDSGTDQQGKAKRHIGWSMAAHGNDLVRRNLYMAAQAAAQHNPAIKALYVRQRQQGKEHAVAIGHCMTKLLRIAYSLWKKNQAFDPNYQAQRQQQQEADQGKEKVVGSKKEVKPHRKGVTTTSPRVHKPKDVSKRQPLNYVVLKSQLIIEDILTHYKWKRTTERGSQLRGACPLCKDQDDRNFSANRSRQVFCCHRCGKKGNALDLLVELSQRPLHEAAWDWIETQGLKPETL